MYLISEIIQFEAILHIEVIIYLLSLIYSNLEQ